MESKMSVIMSTYNTPKEYLDAAINSILNQTFYEFEFLIICDGNKDEYEYIKENYVDDRIKLVLHEENLGLPISLNEAIELSNGKYIVRMDSDDISLNNRLEIQYNYMEKNSQICIAGMYAKCFGENSFNMTTFFKKSDELKIQMLYMTCLVHPTVIIRKDFLIENNLKYNTNYKYAQDFELWSRAVLLGNISVIPKLGLFYRIHTHQISQSKQALQIEFAKDVIKKNAKLINSGDEANILKSLMILSKLIETNESNYKDYAKELNKFLNMLNVNNIKKVKKIIYNRFMYILHYNGLLHKNIWKLLIDSDVNYMIFNFTNMKFVIWHKFNNFFLDKHKINSEDEH